MINTVNRTGEEFGDYYWNYYITNFFIFNKLVNRKILNDDNNRKLARLMSCYCEDYIFGGLKFNSIKDKSFLELITETHRLTARSNSVFQGYYRPGYIYTEDFISPDEAKFCYDMLYDMLHNKKTDRTIPDSLYRKFEICCRLRKVIESTNNMNEILCPELVKVITSEDFYQRLENSLDENNRLRPEVFFKSYRANEDMER